MRLPFTPLGLPQILLYGVLPLAVGIVLWGAAGFLAGILPILLGLFVLSFFRDPERPVPADPDVLVSPADGKVVTVSPVDEPLYLQGRGTRVGIFLSVFNVHVNRAPESGVVEFVQYTPGKFLDARDPRAADENECHVLGLRLDDGRRVTLRLVAGRIARRILCSLKVGDRVRRGQRIGMIKFGSYAELIVEDGAGFTPAVQLARTVHGAADVVFRGPAAARR